MTGQNPYVGARTFKPEEGHLFFGREQEAFDLLSLVISDRLVLFYAQSGAGKSSLINTRLIPGLLGEGEFRIFPVGRLRRDELTGTTAKNVYVYNLLSSLSPQQADDNTLEPLSLSDYLKHVNLMDNDGYLYDEKPEGSIFVERDSRPYKYVLIIDQFEELFTTHEEKWKSRADFFDQFAAAMKEFPRLWIVLVMREDYIAYLDPYIDLLPGSLRTRYYMQRLGHRAAIQAVEGPAAMRDHPFAEGVAKKLIDDLSGIKVRTPDNSGLQTQPGQFVEPVQLQVVCSSLWEKLPSQVNQITQEHLEQYVGDVDQALGNYYEERVKSVAEGEVAIKNGVKERDIREWFGSKLITAGGIRNMIARERDAQSGGLDDYVVQEFVKRGDLVRAETRGGATFYELTHDRLVEPILENNKQWFSSQSSGLLQQQATLWLQQGRNPSLLLRGRALREASKEAVILDLTGDELVFLTASRNSARTQTFVWSLTALVIIALSALSFLAVQASQEAQIQKNLAETQSAAAITNANLAATNEALAQENLQDAIDASLSAAEARALAEQNEIEAQAQRSAARAQIYQNRPGGLYISTLLAIDSLRRFPLDESEEILRKNISLLPLPVAQFSQGGRINAIAVSPGDGNNIFVTASADGSTCAWQMEEGTAGKRFCTSPGEASVNDVAFSPDGSLIITGDQSGLIQVLDAKNGNVMHAYRRAQSTSAVTQIVDVTNGNLPNDFTMLEVPVQTISVHPSNGQVAVAYDDGEIPIFNPSTGKISAPLLTSDSPQVLAFSPNGRLLAAGAESGRVRVWDLSTAEIFSPVVHRDGVLAIAFNPDGRTMATGGKDNFAAITDVRTSKQLVRLPTQNWVRDIAYSPDGTWLVTVSDDHRVRVWDSVTGEERFVMSQEDIVTEVTISSDSRWIATTGDDQTVRVWNAATGAETLKIPLEASGSVLAFSLDSRYLVSTDQRGGIQSWDISVMPAPSNFIRRSGVIGNVQYSPSGEWIAVSEGNIVQLEPAADSRLGTAPTLTFQSNVDHLVFSPDSKFIGILTEGNDVSFYNIQTRRMNALTVSSLIQSIAFSPDSQGFVVADSLGNIQVWDVNAAQGIGNPVQKPLQAFSLASSLQFLALGTQNTIIIVGVDINDEIAAIDAFGQEALLAFSHDGYWLAAATRDGRVDIWRYQNDQFTSISSFVKDRVSSLAFSLDGRMLAVGTAEDVFLMDLASGKEIARIPHPDRVNDLSFSPDGTRLVTASARILQFWELSSLPQIPTEDLVGAGCSRLFENFDPAQWSTFFGNEKYKTLCEALPVPE